MNYSPITSFLVLPNYTSDIIFSVQYFAKPCLKKHVIYIIHTLRIIQSS